MAFDETGQADSVERKVAMCERAFRLLIDRAGYEPEDIIFDPNIFAIATGIAEHANYGVDFIEATRQIKQTCLGVKVSGGINPFVGWRQRTNASKPRRLPSWVWICG